jgi:hypothetical protein
MTYTIVIPNEINPQHLDEVIAEMRVLGAPRIRAIVDADRYRAIEGSHRIAAAGYLGLVPEIVVVDERSFPLVAQEDGEERAFADLAELEDALICRATDVTASQIYELDATIEVPA